MVFEGSFSYALPLQSVLNTCDCLQDFSLHFYLIYLDIRPLSHFTPSVRAWAVSTYICYECRMHSVDDHKGIAWMRNEYVFEVLLGFFPSYLFCANCNIVVLSSISLGANSVANVYVLSCNSSDLQHYLCYYYYHSSAKKRDTIPLSQNFSEGLGTVCCASFPLWCASSCYPQVGPAFTYLDRIIAWFGLFSYNWFVVLTTCLVVDEAPLAFDDVLVCSVAIWSSDIYLFISLCCLLYLLMFFLPFGLPICTSLVLLFGYPQQLR